MILLGAGFSVPFGIPAMRQFVLNFKTSIAEDPALTDFINSIESALDNSERLIGTKIAFDLESLMVVLQDLVAAENKPISAPTFALLLHLIIQKQMAVGQYNTANIRRTFGERAEKSLDRLRKFIFETCIKPISLGTERGSFQFLDLLYTPLFALLGNGDFRSPRTQWIFTTNWDLCIRQWLDYALRGISVEDGIVLDVHREPVFSISGWKDSGDVSRKIVPLHGSLCLMKKTKIVHDGAYEEIHKVSAPEIYFKGNPSEIANALMLFPLEAVGYEQSVRSPYLDMLSLLKQRLLSESDIYIVGFSLRDSTIASIFEEVLRERARRGDWQPTSIQRTSNLAEEKHKRFKEMQMRVFLITSSPEETISNLRQRGYLNLANALIPIKATFPEVVENDENNQDSLKKEIGKLFTHLYDELYQYGVDIALDKVQDALQRAGLDLSFPQT